MVPPSGVGGSVKPGQTGSKPVKPRRNEGQPFFRAIIREIRAIRGPNREDYHGFHGFHGFLLFRSESNRVKASQTGSNQNPKNLRFLSQLSGLKCCMKARHPVRVALVALFLLDTGFLPICAQAAGIPGRTLLADGWEIQSSAKIKAGGAMISTAEFKPADWFKATVPSTVVGCLVEDKVYTNPFFGTNLKSLPGMGYPIGANFSNRSMPGDSPFRGS
jgi:hypothetical protein